MNRYACFTASVQRCEKIDTFPACLYPAAILVEMSLFVAHTQTIDEKADMTSPLKLAVLISGGGTTLDNLVKAIQEERLNAEISLVVSSRPDVKGVEKAQGYGLPTQVISRADFSNTEQFSESLFAAVRDAGVELVILAGYLSLISIPDDYTLKVMNIHPSLIPAFSGPRMYGHHVHQAVVDRGVKLTGCTVHFADNQYDNGPIILQKSVPVLATDTPDDVAARVFEAECEAYPEAIQYYSQKRLKVMGPVVEILEESPEE